METHIFGIDCATDPQKVGLAKCLLTDEGLTLTEAQIGSKTPGVAEDLNSWLEQDVATLIAIDAPLGWPKSLGEVLSSHQAGNYISKEADNLFRRETDRFIQREIGKRSLDVGADRIARTARTALCILNELRDRSKKKIPLAWEKEISGVQAIEVYPAATLKAYNISVKGYKGTTDRDKRKEIITDLANHMEITDCELLLENADVLDAVLCCLAGADFLRGKSMQPENQELAEKEGWIWVKGENRNSKSMSRYQEQSPYPSQRMPVMAKNMVATSQPLAVQAGLSIMRQGGNAIDAAIATAITLTVVEPTSNGIGSDAFCILWDGEQLHGLNASGRSPAAVSADYFAGLSEMPQRGWDSVTVPGCVSAWVALSDRFGRLPFGKLFEAAIEYADNGFRVTPITAHAWSVAPETFSEFEDFAPFLPGGNAPKAGQLFRFPNQARTLEKIADTKGEAFYRGDLADQMVSAAKRADAKLTATDLDAHQADWVDLISQKYNGFELHEIPPNGQGLAALIMLGMLQHHNIAQYEMDSADSLHCQIEAMKLAFADAFRYIADPAYMDINAVALLDCGYLESRAALIDMKKTGNPGYGLPPNSGTVYLTAADQSGMMVSMIQSNYQGFGSGIVIPETGISLQNRAAGFVLQNGHPNQISGGKRPFHTIIPAFLCANGKPFMSFGVMGGHMQAQGHAQLVIRICDYGLNPQAASDAPRWRVSTDNQVHIEQGIGDKVRGELKNRGHNIVDNNADTRFSMGGAQLIVKTEDGYIGGSDHRKDGMAAGF